MKRLVLLVILSCCGLPGLSRGDDVARPDPPLARVSPPYEVAAYRLQDLNRDQGDELLVVGKQGEIQTWSGTSLRPVQEPWRLPAPSRTLLSLGTLLSQDGPMNLVALTPDGLWAYPTTRDGGIDANGVLIDRRMRCQFRGNMPLFSPFLQDINQDGKPDILVPILDYCEIWMNQGVSTDSIDANHQAPPTFIRIGRFPIQMNHSRRTNLQDATGQLSEHFAIPSVVLKDINGDGIRDLIVRHDPHIDYYLLDGKGNIPETPTVSLDLSQFRDTTPSREGIQFGETLRVNKDPQLTECDLNHDGIPDDVIFHGRKLWFFLGTSKGPQFTNPSSILKIADDITMFAPCPLDDDDYPDLLMLRVQIPTLTRLLGALFSDWDIKIESTGYRSKQGQSFELSSSWQGEVYLRLPSILSMISNPDTLANFQLDQTYGPAVQGDFDGDGILDVGMLNTKNDCFECWFGRTGGSDAAHPGGTASLNSPDNKQLASTIRNLLFTKTDNVWDLDRIKTSLNTQINDRLLAVTAGKAPDRRLGPFKHTNDPEIRSVHLGDDKRNELLLVYSDPTTEPLKTFELYVVPKK
jgi:hypothetical protein